MDPLPHVQAEELAAQPNTRQFRRRALTTLEEQQVYADMRMAVMKAEDALTRLMSCMEQDPAYYFDPDYVERQMNFANRFMGDAAILFVRIRHAQQLADGSDEELDELLEAMATVDCSEEALQAKGGEA